MILASSTDHLATKAMTSIEWRLINPPAEHRMSVAVRVVVTEMDLRIMLTTFAAIFLAEMGDKTQLAAITMTASFRKPLSVFLGGALALTLVTALGVLLGTVVTRWIPDTILKKTAILFVIIGLWTWFKG